MAPLEYLPLAGPTQIADPKDVIQACTQDIKFAIIFEEIRVIVFIGTHSHFHP
jgi:hypothetical protein